MAENTSPCAAGPLDRPMLVLIGEPPCQHGAGKTSRRGTSRWSTARVLRLRPVSLVMAYDKGTIWLHPHRGGGCGCTRCLDGRRGSMSEEERVTARTIGWDPWFGRRSFVRLWKCPHEGIRRRVLRRPGHCLRCLQTVTPQLGTNRIDELRRNCLGLEAHVEMPVRQRKQPGPEVPVPDPQWSRPPQSMSPPRPRRVRTAGLTSSSSYRSVSEALAPARPGRLPEPEALSPGAGRRNGRGGRARTGRQKPETSLMVLRP
jgi:hypothetical protein